MKAKFSKRIVLPVVVGLIVPLAGVVGCEKDEPPPPLPSAAPKTEPTEELTLEPEDAGVDDADADADKKPTGPYKPGPSLKACCAALSQNANSAPEPQATYMRQAAATCNAMVASGQGKGTILGAVRGVLKGAGMPSACR